MEQLKESGMLQPIFIGSVHCGRNDGGFPVLHGRPTRGRGRHFPVEGLRIYS
jgi:hypothetical protein